MSSKKGFLLIEAMIALATAIICSLVIMNARIQLSWWHKEAADYFKAVTIANRVFEHLTLQDPIPEKIEHFAIDVKTYPVSDIPYKHVTITVSWSTPQGQNKTIQINEGIVSEA